MNFQELLQDIEINQNISQSRILKIRYKDLKI